MRHEAAPGLFPQGGLASKAVEYALRRLLKLLPLLKMHPLLQWLKLRPSHLPLKQRQAHQWLKLRLLFRRCQPLHLKIYRLCRLFHPWMAMQHR